jgi:hypothetical protein
MDEDAPAAPDWRPPRWVNRVPTPQELLELSHRVYKHSRRLYSEADAQGLRVYHDERLDGTDGGRGGAGGLGRPFSPVGSGATRCRPGPAHRGRAVAAAIPRGGAMPAG